MAERNSFSENMIFLGAVLGPGNNQGTSKTGKNWVRYQLQLLRPGRSEPNRFTVFTPLSGKSLQLNQLQSGIAYNFKYNTEQVVSKTSGETFLSKAVFGIYPELPGLVGAMPLSDRKPRSVQGQGFSGQAPAQSFGQGVGNIPQQFGMPMHQQYSPNVSGSGAAISASVAVPQQQFGTPVPTPAPQLPDLGQAVPGPMQPALPNQSQQLVMGEMKKDAGYVHIASQSPATFLMAFNKAAEYLKQPSITEPDTVYLYPLFVKG